MFNKNLLKAKIIEKGMSVVTISNAIGISESAFYRKLSRDGDFSRFEIGVIADTLNLTLEERDNIFFSKKLA